jgi:adenylylsulfate kinase-like enzyme
VAVISAAISPYSAVRDEVRQQVEQDGAEFIEVFVKCPIDVLAERDVKGLYRRALAGELKGFTGVSDPYEPPVNPDLVIESDREPVEFSAAKIISELERRALVPTLLSETPASVTKPLALDQEFPATSESASRLLTY